MSLHNETLCADSLAKEVNSDSGGIIWEGGLMESESASLMRKFYENVNLRAPRSPPHPSSSRSHVISTKSSLPGVGREKQQRKLQKFRPAGLMGKADCGAVSVDLDVDVDALGIQGVSVIDALRGGQGEEETRSSNKVDERHAAHHDWTFTGVEGEEDELLVMATKVCLSPINCLMDLLPERSCILTHVCTDGEDV